MSEKRKPYIQMRDDLRTCREVRQMAALLERTRNEIVGALFAVWEFANRELGPVSDRAEFVLESDIDHLAELPGFARAMVTAGWLVIGPNWVEFPGYNESVGSRAYHELAAKNRLAAANSRRAANQAAKEQAQGPTLFDQAEDLPPEPPLVTSLVTNPVTTPNGNGNGNKDLRNPPLAPPRGPKETLSAPPNEPKPRKRDREAAEKFEDLAGSIDPGSFPDLAKAWRDWLTVCREKGRLPSSPEVGEILARFEELGHERSLEHLRDWIRRGRYTAPEAFWTSGQAGPNAPPNKPPRPVWAKRMWEENGHWLAMDSDGKQWWDPGKKNWYRVKELALVGG